MAPSPVATAAPIPLQEPHAVDQAPLPSVGQAGPAQPAQPSAPRRPTAAKSSAKPAPARPQATAKARLKIKPQAAQQEAARPKARPAPPQAAAEPAAPPHPQIAVKPKSAPRKLAKLPPRHPMREARRSFGYRVPEERPHSGPVYDMPAGVPSSPALVNGCDEVCQYRDWLNRYAAWYRDFGRYYYGAPEPPGASRHPAPPPAASSENRPAPPPAYRPDQSERARDRDRLDPWHGYNSHSPSNGY